MSHYFATHKVAGFGAWAWAETGKIRRAYAWLGNGTVLNIGKQSKEEKALGFDFSDERSEKGPYDECVMMVAGKWSIDPTKLEGMELTEGLGVVADV